MIRFNDYSISIVAKLQPTQKVPDGPRVWRDHKGRWFVEFAESNEEGVFICPDGLLPAAELRIQAQELLWPDGAMTFVDITGRPLQCYATKKKDGGRGLFSVPMAKGMVMVNADGEGRQVYIAEIRGAALPRVQLGIVRVFPFGEEPGLLQDVPSHFREAATRVVEAAKSQANGLIYGMAPVHQNRPSPIKK